MNDSNLVSLEEGRQILEADARRRSAKQKYHAVPQKIDGRHFASKKEARYYLGLKGRKAAGEITGFTCQPQYPLIINGLRVGTYRADFDVYYPGERKEVVDCKGDTDPRSVPYRLFTLKKNLMKVLYNIDVLEV